MILGTLRRKPPPSSSKGKAKEDEDEDESVTESEDDDGDSDIVERRVTGWVYVGSHNFTTAAWGSFQAKSTSFTPVFAVSLRAPRPPRCSRFMPMKLQVSNYELGVIIPVYDAKEADDIICWERPPKSYESQGNQPWVSSGIPLLLSFLH